VRYYLAGRMSGIPAFNFPAFYAAAADLRSRGYEIISPAELDDQEDKGVAMASKDGDPGHASKPWSHFLARDVIIVSDQVDGIMFLSDDWYLSKGAKLEAFVALLTKKQFLQYNGPAFAPSAVSASWVMLVIAAHV
jgi:hypothetical protein